MLVDPRRVPLLLVLLAAALMPGGCRCQGTPDKTAERPRAEPPSDAATSVSTPPVGAAAGSARPSPSPLAVRPDSRRADPWPPLPLDLLVDLRAPLLPPPRLERLLAAASVALRTDERIGHVWVRAGAGRGRVLVRYAASIDPAQARAKVVSALLEQLPRDSARLDVAATARDAMMVSALSIDAPGGRREGTGEALDRVFAALTRVPGHSRLATCGAVRPFVTLRLLPGAMAGLGVDLPRTLERLPDLVGPNAPGGSVQARLSTRMLARAPSGEPVTWDDLVNRVGGVGEPWACEALVGRQPQLAVLVEAPVKDHDATLGALTRLVRDQRGQLPGGARLFHHYLQTANRFLLRATRAEPESASALGKRLAVIAHDASVMDLFAASRSPGTPRAVDPEARAGRSWTLWVGYDRPDQAEIHLNALRETLSPGGWEVHPLAPGHDTHLSWLLGAWGTMGAVVTSPDPGRPGPVISAIAAISAGKPFFTRARTGPRRRPPPPWYATLRPDGGGDRVRGGTVAAALSLLERPERIGPFRPRAGGETTAIGLAIRDDRRLGDLPMGGGVTLADLRRVAVTDPVLERVQRDGRPALWYVQDTASAAPAPAATEFWRAVRGAIGASRRYRVRSLRHGDPPIAPPGAGR